jgi:glycosyltransferase involved in cell wall biosynthesis
MSKYFYSIIVPVYNRPDEVEELLDSILKLENPNSDPLNYEVIIVEDGSTTPCKDIVDKYSESFSIQYYILEKNTGNPIIPKNTGADYSKGNFLIFLDSDVILPPAYLINVNNAILNNELDAFSGPDMAHSSFNTMQKATSYSMTSFLTTGGIRNKKKNVSGKISFRGYNCGVRKDVFMQVGKYPHIMPSEDILLGYNIVSANYKLGFIENAAVYHKRKTSLKKY